MPSIDSPSEIRRVAEVLLASAPRELLSIALEHAIISARMSPCRKDRRGAAVFNPDAMYAPAGVLGTGYNGQPPPFRCDGTCATGGRCGKLCVHAEDRAIRHALFTQGINAGVRVFDGPFQPLRGLDIVHIALDERNMPRAGGGPSCWQCSRTILDAGLAHVWLYEERLREGPRWWRYTAEEFHTVTMVTCEIVAAAPPVRVSLACTSDRHANCLGTASSSEGESVSLCTCTCHLQERP